MGSPSAASATSLRKNSAVYLGGRRNSVREGGPEGCRRSAQFANSRRRDVEAPPSFHSRGGRRSMLILKNDTSGGAPPELRPSGRNFVEGLKTRSFMPKWLGNSL
ncbi:hypothetical protein CF335_g6666, partial [Tilletia laevis]